MLEKNKIKKIIESLIFSSPSPIKTIDIRNFFAEEKLSLNFLEKNKCVIAFGGGAFMNEKIRKKIKKNSYSFWLNWKIKTILDRISKNKKRPLALKLNNKDLVKLYRERIKFYKLSDFKINCENKDKNEIINNIFKILENENSSNQY